VTSSLKFKKQSEAIQSDCLANRGNPIRLLGKQRQSNQIAWQTEAIQSDCLANRGNPIRLLGKQRQSNQTAWQTEAIQSDCLANTQLLQVTIRLTAIQRQTISPVSSSPSLSFLPSPILFTHLSPSLPSPVLFPIRFICSSDHYYCPIF